MSSRGLLWFGAAVMAAGVVGMGSVARAESGQIELEADGSLYTGTVGAGEFRVVLLTGMGTLPPQGAAVPVGGIFETFCIELNEVVQIGHVYDYTLSTDAVGGGLGGGSPDPLGPATALLYQRFWDGTLTAQGYDYTPGPGRVASASALQLAIWVLEDEIVPGSGTAYGNEYDGNALAHTFVNYALANAPATIGGVRVLNLTENVTVNGVTTTVNRQSVLVRISDPVTPPPGGGGRTPGFWHNKNGQKLIGAADLQMLRDLCLVKANGDDFDPTTKTQVANWILADADDNMAYKLSSMLAAMELNVFNGFVDPDAKVYCPLSVDPSGEISIALLMDMANDELCDHPLTGKDSPYRNWQETLKDVLDDANNNLNWVP